MRRVTLRCAARLVFAALWLLVEVCRAESGAPSLAERVIWAVNAGGDAHTDVHGIHFKKDPLEGRVGKGEYLGFFFLPGCLQKKGWLLFVAVGNE